MKKTLIAAALIVGATTAAFAEDSSSSFAQNIYPQGAQERVLEGSNVALTGGQSVVTRAQSVDRAGNPYVGGGF